MILDANMLSPFDLQESSNPDANTCEQCPLDGGLECFGGMTFDVLPGFWLAPDSTKCRSGDCILSRVYECDIPDACNSTSSRSVTSFATIEDLDICSDGYDPGVVKCAR